MKHIIIATLAAAVSVPTVAFAHVDGHAQMALWAELFHMLSDPIHLTLITAFAALATGVWKGLIARQPARNEK